MSGGTEQRILAMSLEEKVALVHGQSNLETGGCERVGVPGIRMSDGPNGVAPAWAPGCDRGQSDKQSTALPVGTCLASTWDTALAREYGVTLGAEARAHGKDVILGPAVNMRRTPLGGRTFEYMGEDPFLAGAMAAAYVQGVQSQGVGACVKHFACNSHEHVRHHLDAVVEERALREIYLPAFERVVRESGVLCIMAAYNKLRGQKCCHSDYLLNVILKGEWGFDGLVVSDWGGVHATFDAAVGGLDIEMGQWSPETGYFMAQPYLDGLRQGVFSVTALNERVRRILGVMERLGMLDAAVARPRGARNTPAHQATAHRVAVEGMVLLKNEGALLPLRVKPGMRVAVIGENAIVRHCAAGGSSKVDPPFEFTPLEALREILGGEVEIVYAPGYPDPDSEMAPIESDCISSAAGAGRWLFECWGTRAGIAKAPPVLSRAETDVNLFASEPPVAGLQPEQYALQWSAGVIAPVTGEYEFLLYGSDCGVHIDGRYLTGIWRGDGRPTMARARIALEAGRRYAVVVQNYPGRQGVAARLGWRVPGCGERPVGALHRQAVALAHGCDLTLFFGGFTHALDQEDLDLPDMRLPSGQDRLIAALAEANPRLVTVLYGSGAGAMPWIDQVPAVLQAWYPGMSNGRAIVEVLTGKEEPGGRLPMTFYRRLEDCGAHAVGEYHAQREEYRDGVYIGYRWCDARGVEPLFPFGHGLGYTAFDFSGMRCKGPAGKTAVSQADLQDGAAVTVEVDVINRGDRAGAAVVQIYVAPEAPALDRPPRELKGFAKLRLSAGTAGTVRVTLDRRAFAYWHPVRRAWTVDAGRYAIEAGVASRDIRQRCVVDVTGERA